MNQFCEMKGILRQFSVARTPQQNGVVERRNRTLIEAARTMLADSKLLTTFWAEAVNTTCYVQNRVLVVKPHNKTPYELFHGKTPTLSFMRPFGCPVTILNTIDHLGKFDGKADEGFFVGYSLNSKAFRVFNSRTRIVEENLHIRFSESTPNVVGSGPDWLFDIDALTRTMNYEPIIAGTQSNGFAGTKASDNADPKSSHDDGSKPSSDDGKKVNTVSSTVNAAGINEVNTVGGKISIKLPYDPNMSALEDDYIFDFSRNDEDDGAVADMNNLDTIIQVSPNLNTRIHKDHPLDQVIGDLQLATQIRKMSRIWRNMNTKLIQHEDKVDRDNAGRASTNQVTRRIEEEVYVCQPPGIEDQDFPIEYKKVIEVKLQALQWKLKLCSRMKMRISGCSLYTKSSKFHILSCLKRIFRYLKGQPNWAFVPKDSPFDLVAYTDSDYTGASLDRKSTTGGCQFLGCRLISWQCKKQTVVANSTTEAEYVAASSCCGQIDDGNVVWNGIGVNAGDSKLMLLGITYYC
ncbi:ribonuclease H-like domain-containing protein [Tanacetum coccineum]